MGFELTYLTIEGEKIPSKFLQSYKQVEVETSGYDAGADILYDFFRAELPKYLTSELSHMGRKIIEACLSEASVEDYLAIIPMDH